MSHPRVLLVVTGSIAAYKACEVVRRLQDHGASVRVAMTANGGKFVSPLTFAALSGHRVLQSSFDDDAPERLPHVRWAEDTDVLCVVPASADFIARMALGLADDFASTTHLAFDGPVLVAPAMEDQMWLHPAVQANLETLRGRGVEIVEPEVGHLASGRFGPGRLAEPAAIVDAIVNLSAGVAPSPSLQGLDVVVSAGPTHEHFDPVRLLTNPSTGKMGYALATAARQLGANVTLVSGPTPIAAPPGVETVAVTTADEMSQAVLDRATSADVVVMAAAVSDFRPTETASEKLKKGTHERMTVEMERTPDILSALTAMTGDRTIVGFAAETSELEERALEKLQRKGCDLIVANLVGVAGRGFAADTNEVVVLDRLGGRTQLGPASKDDIAAAIWNEVTGYRERVRVATRETTG